MDNSLAPINLNALRATATPEPRHNDFAAYVRAKQMMYLNMGVPAQDIAPLIEMDMRRESTGSRLGLRGRTLQFGYSTPMMGGNLDFSGRYKIAPSDTPEYGVNLRYNREF